MPKPKTVDIDDIFRQEETLKQEKKKLQATYQKKKESREAELVEEIKNLKEKLHSLDVALSQTHSPTRKSSQEAVPDLQIDHAISSKIISGIVSELQKRAIQ